VRGVAWATAAVKATSVMVATRVRRAAALAAAVALALPACGGDGDSTAAGERPRLVVSAASSMSEALSDCSRDYPNATVRLSFAGSDELAAQIRQGVKPDIYAAANTKLPVELNEEGLLETPVEFATNELVLAVEQNSDIDSLDDLREDVKLAIGSESVPIGSYTRETLAKLPDEKEQAILANVRSNEPDVRGIVGKLVQGAADAGFVYVTDVNAVPGGELIDVELPESLQPTVTYGAGVVDEAKEPELARAFIDGLREGACADALADAGFGPPPR
jgi:molybdate transport system substrate-binding protein